MRQIAQRKRSGVFMEEKQQNGKSKLTVKIFGREWTLSYESSESEFRRLIAEVDSKIEKFQEMLKFNLQLGQEARNSMAAYLACLDFGEDAMATQVVPQNDQYLEDIQSLTSQLTELKKDNARLRRELTRLQKNETAEQPKSDDAPKPTPQKPERQTKLSDKP